MLSAPNIVLGLIGLICGFWITKEAFFLNHHVFFLAWAENRWGPGTGTLAYRWIGLAVIVFSVFILTGKIDLFRNPYNSANTSSNSAYQVVPKGSGDSAIAP